MKKLLFGIIATVMFGFAGNAKNDIVPITNHFEKSLKLFSNDVFAYCLPVTISYGSGGFEVSTDVSICCGRVNMGNGQYGYGCWAVASNKPVAYLNVDSLDSKILEMIKSKGLKSIEITKSDTVKNEGKSITVLAGNYVIQTDKEGRFLQVNLEIK